MGRVSPTVELYTTYSLKKAMKLVTILLTIFMVAKAKAEDNDCSPKAYYEYVFNK